MDRMRNLEFADADGLVDDLGEMGIGDLDYQPVNQNLKVD